MKYLFRALTISLLMSCEPCPDSATNELESLNSQVSTGFDSLLAAETGADNYGMRQYIFANLVAGPNRDHAPEEAARLQRAHLDNIIKMAEDGKLVLAGPFMDDQEVRGIYIFAVETIEEARELTNSDPAIQAGRLQMELRPWYGSAALMKLNEIGERLSKEKI